MANVKISALSTLPGNAVSGNDLFLLTQTDTAISRSLSIANARIAISYANDYITYNILKSNINSVQSNLISFATYANATFGSSSGDPSLVQDNLIYYASYANSSILNLQSGLNSANANIYATYLSAMSNDRATLDAAHSNDYSTYLIVSGGIVGANASIVNLISGLEGTNTALSSKDSISNVYATYLISKGGIDSANASISNLQTGLTGANTAIAAITEAPVTFESDVTIRGNLTLTGNTTIVSANTISFGDSLLSLAANNTISDNLDIGLYGHYWNGSANSHTGFFRNAESKDWMLFSNYTIDLEGNSTINISNSSFDLANLRVKSANASLDIRAANSVISSYVYSNGVELRSNDYSTYLTAAGGLSGANTSILNLQSGLEGTNSSISTTIVGYINNVSSNTISLQAGLVGSNSAILNLQTGLLGANTAIVNLQTGLTGANNTFSTKSNAAELANSISSVSITKTYNIIGSFTGPTTGTFRFTPINAFTIKTAQMLNSTEVTSNLVLELSKNGNSLSSFTLETGNTIQTFNNLNYSISTSDYLTVNILSGSGSDFSFTISN